jgi:transglutaminase-like putative cysteine protease
MLIAIRHVTHYAYDTVGSFAVQRLRLTPSDNQSQRVLGWRIEAEGIEQAASYVDGFGNRVHLVTHARPYETLSFVASGEVETRDCGGVIGHCGEVANPRVFLRATPRTDSSAAIDRLADGLRDRAPLERLHLLMEEIAKRVAYEADATHAGTSAAEAFAAGHGVCQDHAHIFIAAARRLAIPARYVTGYLHVEGEPTAVAHHAWAEAWLDDLGWVGFDPANHICPTERYVRLACGFDAASAAPITGTRKGGGTETLRVDVVVRQQQQ